MRRLPLIAGILASGPVIAHPGHGKPAWLHAHGDLLLDAGLILLVVIAIAAVVVRARRRGKAGS